MYNVNMDNIIPTNEYTEFENRVYGNPQVPLDRQNKFIDNLRATQVQQNQEVAQQTQNLGTDVASNLGGLTGSNSYWTSRYQTPQTNSVLQNLRTAAQAAALNQALENEQAMWKNRYQQAYRNYQKRAWDKSNTSQNPSTTTPDNINQKNSTTEISEVQTEALAKSRYDKLLMKYLQAGYPTSEAETKAKEDMGKSISVDSPVAPYSGVGNYKKVKSSIGGDNAYIYTLPNGNTVLVNEDTVELVQTENGGHALKNKETGNLIPVGG